MIPYPEPLSVDYASTAAAFLATTDMPSLWRRDTLAARWYHRTPDGWDKAPPDLRELIAETRHRLTAALVTAPEMPWAFAAVFAPYEDTARARWQAHGPRHYLDRGPAPILVLKDLDNVEDWDQARSLLFDKYRAAHLNPYDALRVPLVTAGQAYRLRSEAQSGRSAYRVLCEAGNLDAFQRPTETEPAAAWIASAAVRDPDASIRTSALFAAYRSSLRPGEPEPRSRTFRAIAETVLGPATHRVDGDHYLGWTLAAATEAAA